MAIIPVFGLGGQIEQARIIDVTDLEAFVVRKDGDGGDVFVVDTTNGVVTTGISHALKRFLKIVTLNTGGEETDVGLTPNAVIMSAAIRVSTEIQGLDSNNHTINLGLNGNIAKYISVAHGSAATTIAKNKKDSYTFDPTTDTESTALKLTIGVGTDKTPSAGAVEVEVLYLDSANLADT